AIHGLAPARPEKAILHQRGIVLHCRLWTGDCRLIEDCGFQIEDLLKIGDCNLQSAISGLQCYALRRFRAKASKSSSQSGLNRTSAPSPRSSRDTASSRK